MKTLKNKIIKTVPQLFLSGLGIENNDGQYKCFYCGGNCNDEYSTKEYVKIKFTNREIVKQPGSEYVCRGCVESLKEKTDIELIDGEKRENQRVRSYTWILTKDKTTAATKKHIEKLREICLNPPKPPFGIILAESGQKHLIFRSRIALSRKQYPISLEEEIIIIRPQTLKKRIDMANRLSAAIGKIALLNCDLFRYYMAVDKYYGHTKHLENWVNLKNKKLSMLAAWLCKNKKESQNEHKGIERRGVQAEISWVH